MLTQYNSSSNSWQNSESENDIHEDSIEQLESQFHNLQLNKIHTSKASKNYHTYPHKYYSRPTPPNLQYKERHLHFNASYSSQQLYE